MPLEDDAFSRKKMQMPLVMHAKSEILKLVRKEEFRWRKAQDAVDDLERRLKVLEDQKVRLEEVLEMKTSLQNSSLEDVFLKSYSTVYVSPIFQEKKDTGIQRLTTLKEEAGLGSIVEDNRNLIIQNLKAELISLKAIKSEHWKAKQREVQFFQMNSYGMQSSSDKHSKEMHLLIAKEQKNSTSVVSFDTAARDAAAGDRCNLENAHNQFHVNSYAPNGFMKAVKRKLEEGKSGTRMRAPFSSVMEDTRISASDRLAQVLNTTEETDATPRAPTAVIKNTPQELCPTHKDSEISVDNKKTSTSELQILQNAICKLAFICQEEISKFTCETDKEFLIGGKKADLQVRVDLYKNLLCELINKLKHCNHEVPSSFVVGKHGGGSMCTKKPSGFIEDSENRKVMMEDIEEQPELECMNNDFHLEILEGHARLEEDSMDLEIKEKECNDRQSNTELANHTSKINATMCSESYYKQQVALLEMQLKDVQIDLKRAQESRDSLQRQLKSTEMKSLSLQWLLDEKEKKMEEFKKRMMAIQSESDSSVIEKLKLVDKLQQIHQEAEKQKHVIKELASQKEELTGSIQEKEDQLAALHREATESQQTVCEKSQEILDLTRSLTSTRKELVDLREGDTSLKRRYSYVKSKLADVEYELSQREEALERMTKHLAAVLKGNDCALEVEDTYMFKPDGKKEERLREQLTLSRMIIDELEEKLAVMEQEISKARTEMRMMRPGTLGG